MKTLIIIPTYNEVENLPSLLHGIFAYVPETDVLVVDDHSPDGTGQLVEELSQQDGRIHCIHRPGKLGLGTAYIAGFKYAISHHYDAAFEMDADFSHDPQHLPAFLSAIKDADLVIGSRYIPGGSTPNWSLPRRLISSSGNIFARAVLRLPVRDCTGGFRCYRREVLEAIDLDSVQSRGYAFQVEMTYRVLNKGFTVAETPIIFVDRRLGQSKMSRSIVLEAFTYVLRTRLSSLLPGQARPRVRYLHRILPPSPLPPRIDESRPPLSMQAETESQPGQMEAHRQKTVPFAIPRRPTRQL
ncbi:dolichyl-phosphate beta-D-mannosyltransferase [Dictyobacter sp. S3.2.2.5]|uniref:Dolichyl-phosphate beta-D-mannosyltransferase n=1 Tax=Dictyobacter halimunensis TaxID=3026934 RepID=A0ABQ6FN51_9CHLR|nr:dolichyl-phosphate beta-D-mannosyltransferase [Dictyobacter sp. S3.2.2.5]